MRIVGGLPESGVRVEIERPNDVGPPWRYRGRVDTPEGSVDIEAVVSADGQVAANAPRDVADKVRLVLRTAWKHAAEDGLPPARRIVRWRPDR
ncbi:MAG TPA: hypothetical protein VKU41_07195 [Polyangiaceae bacterium]|nr:hypothetical protein [Polyangiaceae bacterium]